MMMDKVSNVSCTTIDQSISHINICCDHNSSGAAYPEHGRKISCGTDWCIIVNIIFQVNTLYILFAVNGMNGVNSLVYLIENILIVLMNLSVGSNSVDR